MTVLAAAPVASAILGELPKEQFHQEQTNFMLDLLQIKRYCHRGRALKQKISNYGLASCFVHFNKHADLAREFLCNGGGQLLLDALSRSGNDIQLIYYTLLNVWMLSFTEESVEDFIGVAKHGVIRHVCEILQKVSREKITRVAFMVFENVQESHVCLELMMDNKLLKIIDHPQGQPQGRETDQLL